MRLKTAVHVHKRRSVQVKKGYGSEKKKSKKLSGSVAKNIWLGLDNTVSFLLPVYEDEMLKLTTLLADIIFKNTFNAFFHNY